MENGLLPRSIGQISLQVRDLDGAVEFYGGRLGLRLIGRFPPGLAFFDCAGVRLMLSAVTQDSHTGNSIIYFSVEDIQGSFEALKKRGVEFTHGPSVTHAADGYELWMAFFNDADGNTLAIMDERGELSQ